MDDMELMMSGTQIAYSDRSQLTVYSGSPDERTPDGQWYPDPEPRRSRPPGYVAVRQRHSGCLAYLLEEHVLGRGVAGRIRWTVACGGSADLRRGRIDLRGRDARFERWSWR